MTVDIPTGRIPGNGRPGAEADGRGNGMVFSGAAPGPELVGSRRRAAGDSAGW